MSHGFSVDQVSGLLNVVRDATLGTTFEERLAIVASRLARIVPHRSLSAVAIPRSLEAPAAPPRAFFRNGDVSHVREYAEHYMAFDPCPAAGAAAPGRVGTLSEVVPSSSFGADPFTGEFLPRHDIAFIAGCELPLPDGNLLSLALHRERTQGDFADRELQLLQLVVADIGRAAYGALLREKVERLAGEADLVGPDSPRSGALICDAEGDVVDADPGALRLLSQAATHQPSFLDQFVQEARRLAAGRAEGAARERRVALTGQGAIAARLICLGREARVAVLLERQTVADPSAPERRLTVLAEAWGLTSRERQVAQLAIEGLGNKGIAHRLGITGSTVAVTLTRVYRKARVRGRTELAWRVARPDG